LARIKLFRGNRASKKYIKIWGFLGLSVDKLSRFPAKHFDKTNRRAETPAPPDSLFILPGTGRAPGKLFDGLILNPHGFSDGA
jgi:hypothetical protein